MAFVFLHRQKKYMQVCIITIYSDTALNNTSNAGSTTNSQFNGSGKGAGILDRGRAGCRAEEEAGMMLVGKVLAG